MSIYMSKIKSRIDNENKEKEKIKLIEYVNNLFNDNILSERAINKITEVYNDFGYDETKKAIDTLFDQEIEYNSTGEINHQSFDRFIKKIYGTCRNNQQHIVDKAIKHIKNKCRKKWELNYDEQNVDNLITKILEKLMRLNIDEMKIADFFEVTIIHFTHKIFDQEEWSQKMIEIEKNIEQYLIK